MLEWKKLYGNVFTMYIGPYHNVVLANYKTVMEAFIRNSEDYANRPEFFLFNEIRNNKGISFASGPGWLEQRRFSLKTLRDFGFGRNIIQQRIMEEFSYRTEKLDKELDDLLGKALIMDPHIFLDLMISSIINRILVGYRYNEKRWDEFVKLRLGLEKEFDTLNVWDGAYLNKNTYKLPGLHYRYMMVEEQQEVLMEHMRDVIKKRRDGIASGEYQLNYEHGGDDYLDAYFIMLEQKKRNEEFIGWFSDEALAANLADLWMAGTTTTLQSLSWFLVFTTNNMAVQEKLRNECFSITNRNRTVALADRPHMPYTSAVITELLRCGNILNFSFLRETTRETVVEGHVLPKKANVVAQISLMFRDDRDYPNPFEAFILLPFHS
uniref:Unspecific monooxygenase n=1 Tax=Steinernema glaseri TaxID=37863 RepID=A0A1I8AN51_9BILA